MCQWKFDSYVYNSSVQSHCKLISVGSLNVLFADPALLCCLKPTSSHTQIEPWRSTCTSRTICDLTIGLFEFELNCVWLDTVSTSLWSITESQPSDSLCCDFASDPLDSSQYNLDSAVRAQHKDVFSDWSVTYVYINGELGPQNNEFIHLMCACIAILRYTVAAVCYCVTLYW